MLHVQPFYQLQKQAEALQKAAIRVQRAIQHSLCEVRCLQHPGPVPSIIIRGPFEHNLSAPSLHIEEHTWQNPNLLQKHRPVSG